MGTDFLSCGHTVVSVTPACDKAAVYRMESSKKCCLAGFVNPAWSRMERFRDQVHKAPSGNGSQPIRQIGCPHRVGCNRPSRKKSRKCRCSHCGFGGYT
jgi:hypothetical protein